MIFPEPTFYAYKLNGQDDTIIETDECKTGQAFPYLENMCYLHNKIFILSK